MIEKDGKTENDSQREEVISIKLNPQEKDLVVRASQSVSLLPASFCRSVVVSKAKNILNNSNEEFS